MAHDSAEPNGFGAGAVAGGGAIEASIWNALPHFLPLLIWVRVSYGIDSRGFVH